MLSSPAARRTPRDVDAVGKFALHFSERLLPTSKCVKLAYATTRLVNLLLTAAPAGLVTFDEVEVGARTGIRMIICGPSSLADGLAGVCREVRILASVEDSDGVTMVTVLVL